MGILKGLRPNFIKKRNRVQQLMHASIEVLVCATDLAISLMLDQKRDCLPAVAEKSTVDLGLVWASFSCIKHNLTPRPVTDLGGGQGGPDHLGFGPLHDHMKDTNKI